jgi:3-dehydroquinate synthase
MAEAIKSALIGSAELFTRLEAEAARAPGGDSAFLEDVVRECAVIKAGIVSADPFEQGLRSSLNLGHTVGHALEAAAGYGTLPHGAAVGLGLLCAAWISARMGLADPALQQRVATALSAAGLPLTTRIPERSAVLDALMLDKKSQDGRLRMVLPITPGEVSAQMPVELALLEESLQVITG